MIKIEYFNFNKRIGRVELNANIDAGGKITNMYANATDDIDHPIHYQFSDRSNNIENFIQLILELNDEIKELKNGNIK
jgi:hypothetical protein